jgi:tetratricopeptide (TPR) repeat protein
MLSSPATSQTAPTEQAQRDYRKIIILVADFDGPDPKKYRVTETMLSRLSNIPLTHKDVEVKALGRAITEAEGSTVARAEGNKSQAAMVIWGWYGDTSVVAPVSVHLEVLCPIKCGPQLGQEVQGQIRKVDAIQLQTFTLQTDLSVEMQYLSLFMVGMIHYTAEEWDEAISSFTEALDQTKVSIPALDRTKIYQRRAEAYLKKKAYDNVLTDMGEVIKIDPTISWAYHYRGVAYLDNEKPDRAIPEFARAIQLQPMDASYHFNKGLAYDMEGDYAKALDEFTQSIQIKPDAQEFVARGNSYISEGKYDQAMTEFNQAIQYDQGYADAYRGRGDVYYFKRDYDKAIPEYNYAMKLEGNQPLFYLDRGDAYYFKGNDALAIADYTTALQLRNDYTKVYIHRGNAYRSSGENSRAVGDYTTAIQLKGSDALPYLYRGLTYAQMGERDKAIADCKKVLLLTNDQDMRQQAQKLISGFETK